MSSASDRPAPHRAGPEQAGGHDPVRNRPGDSGSPAVTGRELRTRPADPAQIAHRIADTPQHAAELTAMFTEYGDNGLLGNGRVLGWLLGRESTRYADAVRAELPFSVMEP